MNDPLEWHIREWSKEQWEEAVPAEEAKELEQIIAVTGDNDLSSNTENMKSDNKCQVRLESDNLQVSALLDWAQTQLAYRRRKCITRCEDVLRPEQGGEFKMIL
ncbi:unnamed protein product [Hymenolepis diminuta]|uniref:Aha1_N domain-containing protein n=1 Tax=Hymenolepis diminuta TaxID=6216 RepID=A0A0R3SRA9_HYMDI|nr:unnamed protein product [Hymenolepis diminuta]